MKIVVLMGGDSSERDISLLTGQAVADGLSRAGHDVEAIDIPNVAAVMDLAAVRAADVVFPALHGGQGEGGQLQAVLEVIGVPFALSGMSASALAMDKGATKRIMRSAGVPTPDWLQITWDKGSGDIISSRKVSGAQTRRPNLTTDRILERVTAELGFPLVIKLNSAGSSVGVKIVKSAGDFTEAFEAVVAAGEETSLDIIIEAFIPGRELTAAIMLGRRLPLLEIKPAQGFYDYDNKYTAGASDYLVPAPVNSPIYEQISADALRVFELVGCRGLARADFRLDGDAYHCLEINTIPGMTETSLVPKAAAVVGIDFESLVDELCRAAVS